MFRNRTYTASLLSTFLVSFGFFGAIIFLPRWFQFVHGSSATESGYQIFPLLIGLIGSSIVSGILVSKTGRYKAIIVTGLVTMTRRHRPDDPAHGDHGHHRRCGSGCSSPAPGIGPTLSVFTIVVQNAVPFRQLGVATSNLTFFRQIGGSVGLAVTGTIFGSRLVEELPGQLTAAGVPAQAVSQFSNAGTGALDNLVGVGGDLGAQILSHRAARLPGRRQADPPEHHQWHPQRLHARGHGRVPDRGGHHDPGCWHRPVPEGDPAPNPHRRSSDAGGRRCTSNPEPDPYGRWTGSPTAD